MYEVKGRVSEDMCCHWLIEMAADAAEALEIAKGNGMYEVYALHLSRIAEVVGDTAAAKQTEGCRYYKATVKEERVVEQESGKKPKTRKVTYQMLVFADSVDAASGLLREHLEQGYEFMACAIAESPIDDVIRQGA